MTPSLYEVLLFALAIILSLGQLATLFFTAYQTLISLFGMFSKRRIISSEGTVGERFAILVCAHNEEIVIGEIVKNLMQLDYPKELYDVFVIADNCTDNTALISREHGAIAMERFNKEFRGKGYALEWMIDQLWQREHKLNMSYDAVVIFDADNLVSKNFLKQASFKMSEGHEVMQAYLDSKNPSDTWITKSYAFAYWATSQIYQLARDKVGLSAQLGGTGMVFSSRILKEMGWGATSLTEDLQFTARYILEHDKRVAWIHDARIYDEKPLKMKESYVQRTRWMKGHFDCAGRYFMPLLKKIFTGKRKLLYLDMLVYLIQPSKIVLALAAIGFTGLSLVSPLPHFVQQFVMNHWVWTGVLGVYYSQQFLGIILEKQSKRLWWVFQTYLFSLSWIPIVAVAFFQRKETTWNHTKHTRVITANEVLKEIGEISA